MDIENENKNDNHNENMDIENITKDEDIDQVIDDIINDLSMTVTPPNNKKNIRTKDEENAMDEEVTNNPSLINYEVIPPEPGRKKAVDINYLKWTQDDLYIDTNIDEFNSVKLINDFVFSHLDMELKMKKHKIYKKFLNLIRQILENAVVSMLIDYQISSFPIAKKNSEYKIKSTIDIDKIIENSDIDSPLYVLYEKATELYEYSRKTNKKNKIQMKIKKQEIYDFIKNYTPDDLSNLITEITNCLRTSDNDDNTSRNNILTVQEYESNVEFDENLTIKDIKYGVKYIRQFGISNTPSSKNSVLKLIKNVNTDTHKYNLSKFIDNYEKNGKEVESTTNSNKMAEYIYDLYKREITPTTTFRFTDSNEGKYVHKLQSQGPLKEIDSQLATEIHNYMSVVITIYEIIKKLINFQSISSDNELFSLHKINIPTVCVPSEIRNIIYSDDMFKYFVKNKFMHLYDKEGYEDHKEKYMEKLREKNLKDRIICSIINRDGKINKKNTKKFIAFEIPDINSIEGFIEGITELFNLNLDGLDKIRFRVGIKLIDKQKSMTKYDLSQIIYDIFSDEVEENMYDMNHENMENIVNLLNRLPSLFESKVDQLKKEGGKKFYKLFVTPVPASRIIAGNISRHHIG